MAEALPATHVERVRRFSVVQIIEHWVQVVAFVMLAVTGLPQRYAGAGPSKWTIEAFGGIESIRIIHRVFAVLLMLAVVYHFAAVGYRKFVRAEPKTMIPSLDDLRAVGESVAHGLGLRKNPPKQGRYTWEEKLEYWALIWGTVVMIITGFLLWNPIATTQILPGEFIPAAKSAHSGEALLAVLAVIVWHVYHVHIRTFNRSIFTGYMSREEMEEEHPLELERIEAGEPMGITDSKEIARRSSLYFPAAILVSAILLLGIYFFSTFESTAITTIQPIEDPQIFAPVETTIPPPGDTTTTTTQPTTTTTAPVAAAVTWEGEIAGFFGGCAMCHGTSGGLDLSSYASAIEGGDSGPGIVPGDPDASVIVQTMETGGHPGMLDEEQVATVRDWIAAGAPETPDDVTDVPPPAAVETWDGAIAAVFQDTCGTCHGSAGGLDLSSYASAIEGGDSGPGAVPGDPGASSIVQTMEAGGHPGMLSSEDLERVRAWIAAGAPETAGDVGGEPTPPPGEPEAGDDWNTVFGPIFTQRCTSCHGGDDPAAGLNLETYQGALEGGGGGPGIVPGDPQAGTIPSLLGAGEHFAILSDQEYEAFLAWIEEGAPKAFGPTWAAEVAAVFDQRCVACHNPEDLSGGLDLSDYESALAGGASGAAIVPGDAEASLIVRVMEAGQHVAILTGDLLDELRAWIDDGGLLD